MTTTKTTLRNVHQRRAERAIDELAFEVTVIKRRLAAGNAEPEDARKAAELVATLSGHFGAIEALRDTTEEN